MAIKYLLPSEKSNFLSALPGEPQSFTQGARLSTIQQIVSIGKNKQSLGKYSLPLTKLTDQKTYERTNTGPSHSARQLNIKRPTINQILVFCHVGLWGLSSLPRDQIRDFNSESTESYPLDLQGIPRSFFIPTFSWSESVM